MTKNVTAADAARLGMPKLAQRRRRLEAAAALTHSADQCSGGWEAHEAHLEANGECPWSAKTVQP